MVVFARTNRSKLDSTSTFKDADFWSMDRERKSRPCSKDWVEVSEWTCDKYRFGEKVVEDRRNLFSERDEHHIVMKGRLILT